MPRERAKCESPASQAKTPAGLICDRELERLGRTVGIRYRDRIGARGDLNGLHGADRRERIARAHPRGNGEVHLRTVVEGRHIARTALPEAHRVVVRREARSGEKYLGTDATGSG